MSGQFHTGHEWPGADISGPVRHVPNPRRSKRAPASVHRCLDIGIPPDAKGVGFARVDAENHPPPLLASLRGNERNVSATFAERAAPLIPGRASEAKPIHAQDRASGFRAQRIAGAKSAAPSVLRFLHARARNLRERRCVTFRGETAWSCRDAAEAAHWARANAGASTRCRLAVGLKPMPIDRPEVISLVSENPSAVRAVLRSGRSSASR